MYYLTVIALDPTRATITKKQIQSLTKAHNMPWNVFSLFRFFIVKVYGPCQGEQKTQFGSLSEFIFGSATLVSICTISEQSQTQR